jgi:hypothetical protein
VTGELEAVHEYNTKSRTGIVKLSAMRRGRIEDDEKFEAARSFY